MKLSFWKKYGKGVASAFFAIVFIVIPQVSGDHKVQLDEAVFIASGVAGAVLTYLVPLVPQFKSVKSVANAVLVAAAVATALTDKGFDFNEGILIATSFLSAIGVTIAPAASLARVSEVTEGTETANGKAVVRVDTGLDR